MKEIVRKSNELATRYRSLNKGWKNTFIVFLLIFVTIFFTSKFLYAFIVEKTGVVEYLNFISSIGVLRTIMLVICLVALVWIIFTKGKIQLHIVKEDIIVREIEKDNNNLRKLRVTIMNRNQTQYCITKMKLKWKYKCGALCSVVQGNVIESCATYNFHFKLNVQNDEWHEEYLELPKILVIPAGLSNEPSLTAFDCDLTYEHTGKLNYHPNSGWNIDYYIYIIDNLGYEQLVVEDYFWNGNDYYKSIEDGTFEYNQ